MDDGIHSEHSSFKVLEKLLCSPLNAEISEVVHPPCLLHERNSFLEEPLANYWSLVFLSRCNIGDLLCAAANCGCRGGACVWANLCPAYFCASSVCLAWIHIMFQLAIWCSGNIARWNTISNLILYVLKFDCISIGVWITHVNSQPVDPIPAITGRQSLQGASPAEEVYKKNNDYL